MFACEPIAPRLCRSWVVLTCGVLLFAAGCRHKPKPCPQDPPGKPIPLPMKVGRMDRIPKTALTLGELRRDLARKKVLTFAAVLLSDLKKSIACLRTQQIHHKSCPPPYFIFGDTVPFKGLPVRLGPRVLVRIEPPPDLQEGHPYVVSGYWCSSATVARFCGISVAQVADDLGRRFWKERVQPTLPPLPPRKAGTAGGQGPSQAPRSAGRPSGTHVSRSAGQASGTDAPRSAGRPSGTHASR